VTAPSLIAPAPWSLSGRGFVLIYHFSHAFNARYGFLENYQHQAYKGWLGAVMLVDYESSDVGPYQELLFIPGLFHLGGKPSFSISKIYVSTTESQWNGYNNWGIPKEVASFKVSGNSDSTHFQVLEKGKSEAFFDAQLKTWGPSIPLTSKLLPLSHIIQKKEEELLFTPISVKGTTKTASLQHIQADPLHFPPLQKLKPILCLSVEDFSMQFQPATPVGKTYAN
jgi:hypothetical protein